MGILDWIKAASMNAKIGEEERKYYWVSQEHRNKCREIIRKAERSPGVLVLPWDEWNRCMQEPKRPIESYRVVQDLKFVVRFIKELAGIRTRKEEIKFEELPPEKIRPKKPKEIPKEKPKTEKKPPKKKEKIKKIPPEKIKKEKIDSGRSNLKFKFLAGRLKVGKIMKPDFLVRFENIDEKILEEINLIGKIK